MDRYFHAFESGAVSEAACGHRIAALSDKVRELRLHHAEVSTLIDADELRGPDCTELEDIRSVIRSGLNGAPVPQRKAVLQALVVERRAVVRAVGAQIGIDRFAPLEYSSGFLELGLDCLNSNWPALASPAKQHGSREFELAAADEVSKGSLIRLQFPAGIFVQ